MPRHRRTKAEMQAQRAQEVLNSTVRIDGAGEDQVVKDLLSPKFIDIPDKQAAPIAAALQQLITGQQMTGEVLTKLLDRMDKYDADARKWEEDKVKFMEDFAKKAEERLANVDKDVLAAQASEVTRKAFAEARARNAVAKLAFEQQIATEPKVTVTSMGHQVTTRDGTIVEAERVKIKHMTWVLQPGVATEVPLTVANFLKSRRQIQAEGAERKEAFALRNGMMTTANQDNVIAQKWDAISRKYKTSADSLAGEVQSQE